MTDNEEFFKRLDAALAQIDRGEVRPGSDLPPKRKQPAPDYFKYHPRVAEGAAILREVGADAAADYFMELDRENESLHIRLKNLTEDMYWLERKLGVIEDERPLR